MDTRIDNSNLQTLVLARNKKRITGGKISGEDLRKRARQGAETFAPNHLQLQAAEVQEKIKQAVQDYKTIKKASNR